MNGRRALARLLDVGFPVLALLVGAPPLLVVLGYWLYETLLTSRRGQTVGKRLLALQVVSAADQLPPLDRSAVRAAPILLLAVPFLWALTPLLWATGLHDRAAGTHLVADRWLVGGKPPD